MNSFVKMDNIHSMRTHQQIDARSKALARAIVSKIDEDPEQKGLEKARQVCARWNRMHSNPYLEQWAQILSGSWDDVKAILLSDSEEATALRQSNPFCGVLTPKERWAIYRRFRNHDPR